MYAARALGAEKTGLDSVLRVLILQVCPSKLVEAVISSSLVGALAGPSLAFLPGWVVN